MRRVVIAGGAGFFGQRVADLLRDVGVPSVSAGRSGERRLDVEDRASLRAVLAGGFRPIGSEMLFHKPPHT